jgi:RNA recognition motif-containing protein
MNVSRSLLNHPALRHSGQTLTFVLASKHRGYAFVTFANPADAQDAIDNYDLNELPGYQGRGKFLKCSVAQPNKYGNEGGGENKFDRAGESSCRLRAHAYSWEMER